MKKYRKKPVVIEAEQFHEGYWRRGHIDPKGVCRCIDGDSKPHVHTIHDDQVVILADGDWIIPEPDGKHYYPCKPDIFAATYEEVT